ncbi:hypothetical protein PHMEG_0008891 [Phytophthora megakarya]|uniref:Uncharacterized protein n=1 Tax=Phytophthora megakarya TaxID=4795 RepID=A0A225WHL4_9STRA|nr:hypothetical protein PHMEG_0008891 [Phytophthora megakarya]
MGFHPLELLLLVEALGIFTERHTYCLRTVNAFYSDKHGVGVTYHAAESVTIGLAGSKNDQYGRGAWRIMHATGDPLLIPIKALRHIHKARQELKCEGERYVCGDQTSSEVVQVFKEVAVRVGVRKNSYSKHSIRIGGATWMSDCFEEYPVQAAQATIGLSCRMI